MPPNLRVVEASACENGSNRRESVAASIPIPVSRTANRSAPIPPYADRSPAPR